MRIGCLQFAPQVGDVDNNLNRADAVLNRKNEAELEALDLLVLPEMAFSGYNFRSLQDISPFLEHSGSGISSLWARTIALKYNTTVAVGYPETVDVTENWPTSPEYYNSTIVINGEGETIADYRKTHLYAVDETWALEGRDGFFEDDLPGLGRTVLGIDMDMNPYKFETPWHNFEFAFHVIEAEVRLVIVTMAWLTREEPRDFSRMPAEPDMETLTYWVQRLEPVIRSDNAEEIIFVFCNRTGTEDEAVYAGTSAVLGIKEAEVTVYGLLGRGVKDILIVDTENPPLAKLVYRPESVAANEPTNSGKASDKDVGKPAPPTPALDIWPDKEARALSSTPVSSAYKRLQGMDSAQRPMDQPVLAAAARSPSAVNGDSKTSVKKTAPTRPTIDIPARTRPNKEHADTPHPASGQDAKASSQGRRTTSPRSGRASEKYFWLPSPDALRTPAFASAYPPHSPTTVSSLVKLPTIPDDDAYIPTFGLSELGWGRSRTATSHLKDDEDISSTVGESGARDETIGPQRGTADPIRNRPSSSKSRHIHDIEQQLNRQKLEDHLAATRAASAQLEIQRQLLHSVTSKSAGPSHSKNAARATSPPLLNQPASQSIFKGQTSDGNQNMESPAIMSPTRAAAMIHRPHSDIFKGVGGPVARDREPERPSMKPAMRSNSTSEFSTKTSPQFSAVAKGQPGALKSAPHIEPDETRTAVWSEVSKMLGEMLQNSEGEARQDTNSGDRISRPVSTSGPTSARPAVRSGSLGASGMVQSDRVRLAQNFRGNVSNTDLNRYESPNRPGPARNTVARPRNPDDEIVAEIIFHGSTCPTHSHTHRPNGQPSSSPPDARDDSQQQRSASQSRQTTATDSAQGSRAQASRLPRRSDSNVSRSKAERPAETVAPASGSSGKRRSRESDQQEAQSSPRNRISPTQASRPAAIKIKQANASPPTPASNAGSGSSTSYRAEPTTPKAMTLEGELSGIMRIAPQTDDYLSGSGTLPGLSSSTALDMKSMMANRPRSTVG